MKVPPAKGVEGGPGRVMDQLCRSVSEGRVTVMGGGGLVVRSASSWEEGLVGVWNLGEGGKRTLVMRLLLVPDMVAGL